jgi:hypothetical protein
MSTLKLPWHINEERWEKLYTKVKSWVDTDAAVSPRATRRLASFKVLFVVITYLFFNADRDAFFYLWLLIG